MTTQTPDEGAVGVIDAPLDVDEASDRGRRRLLLLIGLGLVVVAAAAWFLLKGSGSEEPVPAAAPAPVAAAAEEPVAEAPEAPPVAATTTGGSDPFKPLLEPAEPEPTAAPANESANAAGDSPAGAAGTAPTSVAKLSVVQVADDGSTVSVTVDGQAYNALTVGSPFGQFYKVYGIFAPACAGFLYGDQAVGGCEGDSISVSR